LELLHELAPNATQFGFLVNPNNVNSEPATKTLQTAASALGLKLVVVKAGTENELELAFITLEQQRVEAVLVHADVLFNTLPEQFVALAARHRLPAMYQLREFAVAGGLMSYGTRRGLAG
jgi:putative tryptophan/tyrosine transport system substrate-binding protein